MPDSELLRAVKLGDSAQVDALASQGADLDEASEEQQWTPLCFAAGRGDLGLVKLLVDRGADVFKMGRDLRTPYKIAMAAGHLQVGRYLAEAEARGGGDREGVSSLQWRKRPYCKAYAASAIAEFVPLVAPSDTVVFVHHDLSVTKSAWHGKDVVLDGKDPAWREFCINSLAFRVPDDFDLASPPT